MGIRPEVFSNFSDKVLSPWATLLAALTFTNQAWINFNVFANPPYWSLGYEILYYALFAVIYYLAGFKRLILSALILFLMGPSIVLYIPVWLLGVVAYTAQKNIHTMEKWHASTIFLVSLAVIAALSIGNVKDSINQLAPYIIGDTVFDLLINPAQNFLTDYLLAIAVMCNILSYPYCMDGLKKITIRFEKQIRYLASYTFSTYLYHFPVLCFFAVLFPFNQFPIAATLLTLVVTPLTIYLLGYYTEMKKIQLRQLIIKMINLIKPTPVKL